MSSAPTIHGINSFVSATVIRDCIGDALGRIRSNKRMTWAEMGEILGKSEDQVAKYADGSAEMSLSTYYRAKQAWGSEFSGAADQLTHGPSTLLDGQKVQTCLLKSAAALSVALEDGNLSVAEIRHNRASLEQSRDAIDGLLDRLTPRAA